ncbi:MAG: bifunctional hydroxymethylpyrimidine kinase/phosphomethylpyrimidine kinase [Lentisphaeria bacterium]|nr:bifunctional hydroxymethylpyrimidine kinase/phosphomethylpyrimidine kinase [Lentisphaeria bacterium]
MKTMQEEIYPVALTISGSDSSGGAGIQADLRTFNAYGVYGSSVITSVAARNPDGVRHQDVIPAAGVTAQLEAVLPRLAVRAVKTGLLGSPENVRVVAVALNTVRLPVVVDPALVTSGGIRLAKGDILPVLREELLPRADWVTPNIPEAELLLGRELAGAADYAAAATEIAARWNCICVLTTGRAEDLADAVDFVALADGRCFTASAPRLPELGKAVHGAGCTFSSAITAVLAQKQGWKTAVAQAKSFVLGSLAEPALIGKKLQAMYPPVEDYDDQVVIAEYV